MSDTSPNAVPQTTYDYLVELEHALCNRQPCLDLISTLRAELPQGPEQRFLNQLHNDLTTVSTVDQLISHRFAAIWIPLLLQSQNSNSSPRSLKRMLSLVSLESSLARQRRNANLYPLALTLLSCTILIVACATIVPVFTVMYDDFQMHQPLATLWLTGFSRQLVEHPLIVSLLVIFVIAAFFTLRRLWLQFELTQRWFGRIMPARIDGLAKVAAFSGSVAELIPHHVPVPVALQISAKYANSPYLENASQNWLMSANKTPQHGTTSIVLADLPPTLAVALQIGKNKTPNVAVLRTVADIYEQRFRSRALVAYGVQAPMAILAIGGIIGLMVISLFLPLFKLIDVLSS